MSDGVVLVTGGSGALGRQLLGELSARGIHTRGLVHRRPVDGAGETVTGDISDPASLSPAVAGVESVVHLAALTHARRQDAYTAINRDGTRNLVAACAAEGVRRLVHVSTRAISPHGGAYSRSKHAAEEVVRAGPVPWVILRLPEVYGTGGREGADRIVTAARAGARIPVVGAGDDEVCPMFVDDAIDAMASAVAASAVAGQSFTLAGECMTMRDFAERCVRHYDTGGRVVGMPVALVRALAALGRVAPIPIYPDQLSRLRTPKPAPTGETHAKLGLRARPLDEGLRAMDLAG
jgi:nucleoside-diphosphate-sugar epimerase